MTSLRPLLAVAVFLAVGGATMATASTPIKQGYWWVVETGLVPAPGPTSVPSGGSYVAADPAQEEAVTAVRLPAAGATVLTLTAADVSGSPALRACATTNDWAPGGPNDWSTRPTASCDTASAPVAPDAAGKQWRVPLSAFAATGVSNILIEPAALAQWSISFQPVTNRSFTFALSQQHTAGPASGSSAPPATGSWSGSGSGSLPASTYDGSSASTPSQVLPAAPAPSSPALAAPEASAPQVAAPTTPLALKAAERPSYVWVLPLAWIVIAAWIWRARRSMRLLSTHPLAGEFDLGSLQVGSGGTA